MSIRVENTIRYAGQSARIAVLALPSIREFKELRQNKDIREDVHRIASSLAEFDRTEIVIYDGNAVVGGATIVLDDDQHVGPCLSLQWQYVLPAYRRLHLGRHFVRELLRQAGWAGIRNVSYSHRTGEGQYTITYREVEHGQESKKDYRQG
jgi:GNAT superfamily N-acetyltransferase